jgi:hypothetical protein
MTTSLDRGADSEVVLHHPEQEDSVAVPDRHPEQGQEDINNNLKHLPVDSPTSTLQSL